MIIMEQPTPALAWPLTIAVCLLFAGLVFLLSWLALGRRKITLPKWSKEGFKAGAFRLMMWTKETAVTLWYIFLLIVFVLVMYAFISWLAGIVAIAIGSMLAGIRHMTDAADHKH